jgi:phosphoglycerate dehydrogenase-like enzyme
VIGAGHTGRAFIKLLNCVGAKVWVYDPYLTEEGARELNVKRIDSLDHLLESCRIVSLQAPVTDETRHMIAKRELALLPDGALLVNTARSALVDTDALLAELQSGRISAGIDVFDEEPLPVNSPFRKLDNCIISPHLAGHTVETHYRQGAMCVDEVRRFVQGKPLKFAITRKMLATMA